MKDIEYKLKKIISELSPIIPEISEIGKESLLESDLAFGSFEFIQLVVLLEEEYHFEFDAEYLDISILKTVGDIFDYLNIKMESEKNVFNFEL